MRLTFYAAYPARMVKLVDTLGSGSSGRKAVEVRVLFRALIFSIEEIIAIVN